MRTGPNPPPGPLSRELARILRDVVRDQDLSQTEIAKRANNISQSHLSKCLRAERAFLLDQLYNVCLVLDLSIVSLVDEATAVLRRSEP